MALPLYPVPKIYKQKLEKEGLKRFLLDESYFGAASEPWFPAGQGLSTCWPRDVRSHEDDTSRRMSRGDDRGNSQRAPLSSPGQPAPSAHCEPGGEDQPTATPTLPAPLTGWALGLSVNTSGPIWPCCEILRKGFRWKHVWRAACPLSADRGQGCSGSEALGCLYCSAVFIPDIACQLSLSLIADGDIEVWQDLEERSCI